MGTTAPTTTAAFTPPKRLEVKPGRSNRRPTKISWAEFEREYLHREDGFKYEWNDGQIEKSTYTMEVEQLFIVDNLMDFMNSLRQNDPSLGRLYAETDIFFSPKTHKRPDLCYLTKAQRDAGRYQIPGFVIEIISPTDRTIEVNKKLEAYFSFGVQVIWHVYPNEKVVHAFENTNQMRICRGEDFCSAEPIIPGFRIPVSRIFQKN